MLKNATSTDRSLFRQLSTTVLSKTKILIYLVLFLGGFLRFYHLDGYGLWSDEFVTLVIVSKGSLKELVHACFEVPQPIPPLYFLLDKLWVDVLGPSEVSLRSLSAISSTLTIYFVWAIGKTLFNQEIGLYSALLCAINSTQIVYAQNARPYAFCLLLSGASILSFLKWTESERQINEISYVISTTLLLYTHYIFLAVMIIQNLYFLWVRCAGQRASPESAGSKSWLRWFQLQFLVGLLLIPLFPQIGRVFQARQALNWASTIPQYAPQYENFFFFLNRNILFFSWGITLVILGLGIYLKGIWGKQKAGITKELFMIFRINTADENSVAVPLTPLPLSPHAGQEVNIKNHTLSSSPSGERVAGGWVRGRFGYREPASSLLFVLLWYLVPLILVFFLARWHILHLFVERYLILVSLATYVLLPSISLSLCYKNVGRTFLWVYLLVYAALEPGSYFSQKGQFSQGIPGGNEWRETLTQLKNPVFKVPLFLFQSPFIESNQLDFVSNVKLMDYLSAPLHSFYLKDFHRPYVLLPVHWWIQTDLHKQYKRDIKNLLLAQKEFVLLSTQEFWNYFKPWLERELPVGYEVHPTESFSSSGALCLRKIQLIPLTK